MAPPAMRNLDTIILTSATPELLRAAETALPGMQITVIGEAASQAASQTGPKAGGTARMWCFVDWLLPAISGLEMCRRLRDTPATAQAHITLLLEDDEIDSRRRALRAGADDYLTGPLSAAVLIERIRQARGPALPNSDPERLALGALTLDLVAHQVRYQGRPVILRPNEFRLLAHFVAHPDRVFSRSSLIDQIGKDGAGIDERTVDVWVGRLRRSLAAHNVPDPLRTVRTLGYVLDSPPR